MASSNDHVVTKISRIISLSIIPESPQKEDITAATPLLSAGLSLDSVATLELVVQIEDEFRVTFDDEELSVELFKTVGSLADAVTRKLDSAGAEPSGARS